MNIDGILLVTSDVFEGQVNVYQSELALIKYPYKTMAYRAH